jgi:ABC-type transporter Mla maintaining outer membrane lipid asymmetry ATPase subunit MlaF
VAAQQERMTELPALYARAGVPVGLHEPGRHLFSRLRAERPGMTMIIVTHDIRVAGTADRIIWLRDGRVDRAHGAIGSR